MLLLISITSLFLLSSSLSIKKSTSDDENISESEMSYLLKYKYITKGSNNVAANLNNDNNAPQLNNAISDMQKFFNLTVTGRMNKETSSIMKKPRCGVPDIKITYNSEYNIGAKWNKKHLTWKVSSYTKKVTNAVLLDVIEYSLNVWAEVSGLTFEYKPSSSVDIEIGFYKGAHLGEDEYDSFDGRNGVLAHAYFPMEGEALGGDTHMDDDELWAVTKQPSDDSKISLAVVFVHEFGHALGLDHEPDVSDSIMRPIYSGWAEKVILSSDDIAGIQEIYGKPTNKDSTTTKSSQSSTKNSGTTTTTQKPQITTTKDTVDSFCRGDGIDAAVEYNKNSYLLFKGNEIRRVSIEGEIKKYKVRKMFDGTLKKNVKIDAAIQSHMTYWNYNDDDDYWEFDISGTDSTYLFQGNKVHTFFYFDEEYIEESVDYISRKFSGLPNNLDAAFTWSGNNEMYFIKGDKFYRVSETFDGFAVDQGYPKDLSTWKGLPQNLDAALNMRKFDMTTFFKGDNYYVFNDDEFKVESGFPQNVGKDWFDCSPSGLSNLFKEEKLPISRITNNAEVVPDDKTQQRHYNGTLPKMSEIKILNEPVQVTKPPKGSGAMKITTTFITFVFALFITLF